MEDYLEIGNISILYCVKLLEAQNKLLLILRKLQDKSQGKKYGFFEYHRDTRAYKRLVSSYFDLGNGLNNFMSTL